MSQKTIHLFLSAIVTAVVLLLLSIYVLPRLHRPTAEKAPLVLKAGFAHSPGHSYGKGFEKIKEIVEWRTSGRIRIDLHPDEQLGTERQMQEMLKAGTLDLTIGAIRTGHDSLFSLLELPYLLPDTGNLRCLMQSTIISRLEPGLVREGFRILGVMSLGCRHITANRPIRTPADLRYFIIRTPESPSIAATFRSLDARPIQMAFSKVYEAIAAGVVEGEENPLENIYDGRLYEVQKYLSLTGHIRHLVFVQCSERTWQRLSYGDREILRDAVAAGSRLQIESAASRNGEYLRLLKDKGMTIIEPDTAAFKRACEPVYASELVRAMGEEGAALLREVKACGR